MPGESSFRMDLGPRQVVGRTSESPLPVPLDRGYASFLQPADGASKDTISLRFFVDPAAVANWQEAPEILSSPRWCLRGDDRGSFVVGNAFEPPQPFWIAHADSSLSEFRIAHLHTSPPIKPEDIVEPALRILSRLALMHQLLEKPSGLFVHTAAAIIADQMYLFVAPSGGGKSTLARLMLSADEIEVVNDERLLLTCQECEREGPGNWTAWGMPWPGELGIARNRHAPLAAMLFLTQAERSLCTPLAPEQALSRLLPVTSIPWYDEALVPRALDLCETLVNQVPAHTLRLRPDASAVTAVLELAAKMQASR